jgi:hypothetical protein
MPKAKPMSTTPPIIATPASGTQITANAEISMPSSRPFSAPCHAARPQPSLPVIFSTERSPLPTIAMSRAGTSFSMSFDTARCAPSYFE